MTDELECVTRLSTNDTNIGISSTDISFIEFKLNNNLVNLCEWSQKWLIALIPNKTNVLMFFQIKMPNECLVTAF